MVSLIIEKSFSSQSRSSNISTFKQKYWSVFTIQLILNSYPDDEQKLFLLTIVNNNINNN